MSKFYVTRARRPIGLSGVTSQPLGQRNTRAPAPVILDVPLPRRGLSGLDSQGLARTLSGVTSQPLGQRNTRAPAPIILDVPLSRRGLSGIESQGIARTLSGPFAGALGEDVAPDNVALLRSIMSSQDAIKKQLEDQERKRRMAFYVGIGSAIFAAARLGVIAFPAVRRRFRPVGG
jgi:hypothetical protein